MEMCSTNSRKRWKLSQLCNNNKVCKGCLSDYVVNISCSDRIKVHVGRLFSEFVVKFTTYNNKVRDGRLSANTL
jgi:hypothetical protein